MNVNIGDKIRINYMKGEPQYAGKEGTITHIDDFQQLFGTWGGLAVVPDMDDFTIIKKGCNDESSI